MALTKIKGSGLSSDALTTVRTTVASVPLTQLEVSGTVTANAFVGDGSGLTGVTSYTQTNFDSDFGTKSTSNLTEGTNLYYTTVRGDSDTAAYLVANGYDTATNIVASIVDTAPTTLDTLNELAAALGDDPNFATTVAADIAAKLDSAEALALFSGGTGVTYNGSGQFSIGQDVATSASPTFAGLTINGSVSATSFTGDGSGLTGVTSYTDSDTLSFLTTNSYATQTYVNNATAALPDSAQVSGIITADVDKAFVDALNVDADTLDGQQGSYYLDYNNFTNTPSPGAAYDTATLSTGFFALPSGTTAQRPGSPANGYMRYNTTNSEFEIYQAGNWRAVSSQIVGAYEVEYLVIAGGGGGSNGGTKGSDSTFHTITSTGGGQGFSGSGGSGGGATFFGGTGGAGTTGQGFRGGNNPNGSYGAGGGGGAGAQGADSTSTNGSNGGNGVQSSITGTATYRAGGAGGEGRTPSPGGSGGLGGGGNGGSSGAGSAGAVNTGSGGGNSGGAGGYRSSVFGESSGGGATAESPLLLNSGTNYTVTVGAGGGGTSNGGSGVVIIRYAGSQRGTGGTVTQAGGYTIHTFTSSGTYSA